MSSFKPVLNEPYVIYSPNNKTALDLPSGQKDIGLEMFQCVIHRRINQQWFFETESSENYYIKSACSNLYLKLDSAGKLVQGEKEGSFSFPANEDGTYSLVYNPANLAITIPWKDNSKSKGLDPFLYTRYKPGSLIPGSVSQAFTIEILNPYNEVTVYDKIMALKSRYPDGMPWTNANKYNDFQGHVPGDTQVAGGGGGCVAFAMILSDAAFDKMPARQHRNFDDIRIGDIVRGWGTKKDDHSVVIIGKDDSNFTFAEGNVNSVVLWGSVDSISEVRKNFNFVWTRYPENNS